MKIKLQTIFWLVIGSIITGWFVFNQDYMGNSIRHFIMELTGAMIAFAVTITAFNVSIEQREGFSPYIALAFLAAGIVDMFHALFAIDIILLPRADLSHFIPGTWTAGRTVLAAVLLYGINKNIKNHHHRPKLIKLLFYIAGMTTIAMSVFALIQLPAFITNSFSIIHRPWELLALLFFLISLYKVYKNRDGNNDLKLIIPSISLGILTQILMTFSWEPIFNSPFDGSHLLKDVSYLAMFVTMIIVVKQRAPYSYKISTMRSMSWFAFALLAITIINVINFAIEQKIQKEIKEDYQEIQTIEILQNYLWNLNNAIHNSYDQDNKAKDIGEEFLVNLKQFSNNPFLEELDNEHKSQLRALINKIINISKQIFLNTNTPHRITVDKSQLAIEEGVFDKLSIELNRIIEIERKGLVEINNTNSTVLIIFQYWQMIILLFVLPALIIIGIWHIQKQVNPIILLTNKVTQIQKGNMRIRLDLKHDNEVGSLASAFNSLLDSLHKKDKVLKETLLDMEKSRDEIDGILKSISDGLIVTDNYNRVILMNRIAEEMLDVRFSEVINRQIDYAIKEEDLRERVKYTLAKKESGDQFDFELPGDNEHPKIFRARTSVILDKNNKINGIITIFHDVSHEREVDRMKTEFISTAAHELRTPLTSIQGFSEILLTRDDLDIKEKKKFLGHINKQSTNLSQIITDLLDISRLESGKGFTLDKKPCLIGEAIKMVTEPFITQNKIHTFEIELPKKAVEINVDKDKMAQVLKNLIGNAVKYSPDGGKIQIKGELVTDNYQVSVRDEGLGMTPDQVEQIFNRFYRADTSNTAIEGTGLGMSIVKYIVEAHSGKVYVESEIGKGTKVTFSLPLEEKI